MFITNNGDYMTGGKFVFTGQVAPSVDVASVTFSGINGDSDRLYGVSFLWRNPITGARKLLFQPNGSAPPAGSSMQVDEFEVLGAVALRASDPDFGCAQLTAAAADTFVQGTAFFASQTVDFADGSPVGRAYEGRGYAEDQAAIVGVQRRHFYRSGFWKEVHNVIESITIIANPAGNAIGAGSDFRLWRPI
jgi:hypothetical protein